MFVEIMVIAIMPPLVGSILMILFLKKYMRFLFEKRG
jgi:hypothetical protein